MVYEHKKRGRPLVKGMHISVNGIVTKIEYAEKGAPLIWLKTMDVPLKVMGGQVRDVFKNMMDDGKLCVGCKLIVSDPVWVPKGEKEFVWISNNNKKFIIR